MLTRFWLIAAVTAAAPFAQSIAQTLAIQVTEADGIRRTAFPASARAHFAQGVLRTPANARLTLSGKESPAQYSAEKSWADGTVEWLDVDWNVTIGPGETQAYQLEYGAAVSPSEAPRGLSVTEDGDAIQVGTVRFGRSGNPLILSVKYRGEEIGQGINGLVVTDDAGQSHAVSSAKAEIVKRGPLVAVLRYSGTIVVDNNYSAPFVMTIEMPNSKTMVKISVAVEDPGRRLREVGVGTPFAFGALPWVWDFGTSRWTYGSLRNAADSVTLTQSPAGDWTVQTGAQLYEKSPAGRTDPVQWGHFQDGKEVVAFALERSPRQSGTWRVTLTGTGQANYRFAPSPPATHHDFAVYQHFITTPVQIGAATSPSAILSPLKVVVLNQ